MKYEKNREKKVFGYRMSEDEQEYINSVIKKYKKVKGKTTTNMIMEMIEMLDNNLCDIPSERTMRV
jgi:hypothetical protein